MKKFLIVLSLFLSTSVLAQHYHYRHFPAHGHGGGNGWGWVAPIIIGGAIGYSIAKPAQAEQPPVIVQQSNQVIINGMLYQKQFVYFDDCKCYKEILAPIR